MRRAARKDANHADMVAAFERIGCAVADLSTVGNGIPDLLVSKHGEACLCEIKMEKGNLRKSQSDFAKSWKGEIRVVRNVEDAQEVADWLLDAAIRKTGYRLGKK